MVASVSTAVRKHWEDPRTQSGSEDLQMGHPPSVERGRLRMFLQKADFQQSIFLNLWTDAAPNPTIPNEDQVNRIAFQRRPLPVTSTNEGSGLDTREVTIGAKEINREQIFCMK